MAREPDEPFNIEDWFTAFVADLRALVPEQSEADEKKPHLREEDDRWPSSLMHFILEDLSDSANELLLNAIAAAHLRRHGRKRQGDGFWVRREWTKTDISYGLAQGQFRDWNLAWWKGTTGDLGQIEAKLCYTHLYAGRIGALKKQLSARRVADTNAAKEQRRTQSYHGLVWLMRHEGGRSFPELDEVAATLVDEAGRPQLVRRDESPVKLTPVGEGFHGIGKSIPLGRLWPSAPEGYQCSLSVALFRLE